MDTIQEAAFQNAIAEKTGNVSKIVGSREDLSESIVSCTVDFSQGMAVRDAIKNDCDYTGKFSR